MRDDLSFAERLREDLSAVPWPEPAEIRARAGRRRQRRTALGAAVVLLVVASGVVTAGRLSWGSHGGLLPGLVGQPTQRAEIPVAALLDPADLPVSSNLRLGDSGLAKPVSLDAGLELCDSRRTPGLPVSRYSRSQTLIQRSPASGPGATGAALVSQDVYRLTPEAAEGFFAGLDDLVATCSGARSEDTGWTVTGQRVSVTVTHDWTVSVRDFAGDEAVLLQHSRTAPTGVGSDLDPGWAYPVENTLVVRVGDLISVIVPATGLEATPSLTLTSEHRNRLLDLGRAAAERMCVAANPACR
ncbi:hypothetical protein AWW66_19930 [Micromonospora rosaria]|uniref:Uncharacterized protein n=1 Tax=Micromonospora rosaria TaxID=47874 RepID=A0A136PP63_9ACTN|nr:hypothetical protein [Micromonospora rosaria]KXK60212.1 hypothetical protein AWW66_19930 [Micromonospora rosaria]